MDTAGFLNAENFSFIWPFLSNTITGIQKDAKGKTNLKEMEQPESVIKALLINYLSKAFISFDQSGMIKQQRNFNDSM